MKWGGPMTVNFQFKTNTYNSANSAISGNLKRRANNTLLNSVNKADVTDGHISLKHMMREAEKQQGDKYKRYSVMPENSVLGSAQSYAAKLKADRNNLKNGSLEKKKLKYQFKNISSQIVRSKTSQAAKQAISQANREVQRLKREKLSGDYDSEEIDAAISHAKSMERVARKKERHLEEEEMAKASDSLCVDVIEEKYEDENALEEPAKDEASCEDEYYNPGMSDMAALVDSQYSMGQLPNIMDMMQNTDAFMSLLGDSEEITMEMFDELSEGMQDLLDELGFGDFSDSLEAIKGDMDPSDLKLMKLKHRCSEMKDIVKADADYLKVVFEQYAKASETSGIDMSV